jgi:hypothetical protein
MERSFFLEFQCSESSEQLHTKSCKWGSYLMAAWSSFILSLLSVLSNVPPHFCFFVFHSMYCLCFLFCSLGYLPVSCLSCCCFWTCNRNSVLMVTLACTHHSELMKSMHKLWWKSHCHICSHGPCTNERLSLQCILLVLLFFSSSF